MSAVPGVALWSVAPGTGLERTGSLEVISGHLQAFGFACFGFQGQTLSLFAALAQCVASAILGEPSVRVLVGIGSEGGGKLENENEEMRSKAQHRIQQSRVSLKQGHRQPAKASNTLRCSLWNNYIPLSGG